MNTTNLDIAKEAKEVLEIVLIEVWIEWEEEKQRTKKLEIGLEEFFQMIPYNALARELNAEKKLNRIA